MQRQQTGGRLKAALIFAFSLIAAGVAVLLVYSVLNQANVKIKEANEQAGVDAVVAIRDLNVGLAITEEDVRVRALPLETLPPIDPSSQEPVYFTSLEEVIKRIPRERILANEVLRVERLSDAEAGLGLNALITPGNRAMAVAVDSESGVAGFIRPGNFVDVIVTIRPDDPTLASAKWVSHAFLQGKKVLAVGSNMVAGETADATAQKLAAREKPTVTLELGLADAEELALSASKGDIHLVLRNDVDITQLTTQGAVSSTLIGGDPNGRKPTQAAASSSTPTGPQSEVIRGTTTTTVEFRSDGSKQYSTPDKKR